MRIVESLVLAASLVAAPFAANAADYIEREAPPAQVVVGLVPSCEDPRVLGQVEDQFEYGAPHMLQSDVTIAEFSNLTEKAYLPRTDNASVERRYCQGSVLLSNQQRHTVYYRVSYPLGYASFGWKAEGCVLGLDDWNIYGANCSSLRRF
ncbi:hypothetical protein GCM10011390_00470 [Aureimonas endophytica]|uniref:Outer membrane surface antigen n=1 Tax=Aureimonas endophytica TaxID=2027858 RepID=A0A916ZBG0_9HYPH|nr:hypothetical protein [Aureimonas endophytica]GGD85812.1 hypothetical protein GCM10011390_00470 [Aureimonas endophytica]